jgi:methionyl-tRNA formyltransferase
MLRVVFMGSPAFAVPALRALLGRHEVVLAVSQPDKPSGRGRRVAEAPVATAAREAGIEVAKPRSARRPEFAEQLRATGADVGVVVAYGKILPLGVLEAFPRGCLNIHASLLPAYRGAAPIQWAIIRGETETGITIMRLDEGMDTGPMLLSRAVPIAPEDTAGSLAAKLAPVGAEMLVDALTRLEAGELAEEPQDDSLASYAPMLKKEHGTIDWSRPASEVRDLIRGVDPWPGATSALEREPLKLHGARAVEGSGEPGEVLAVGEHGLVVACGAGAVEIAEVQAAGKKRMAARDFALGRRLGPGARLGGGGLPEATGDGAG